MIERTFQDIQEGQLKEAGQQSFLVSMGWSTGTTWEDLLRSKRVLIVGEAGTGKTYECRRQKNRLRESGEPAFFIELATLATAELRSQMDDEEEACLDKWLSSQSDVATFFLDSIDELKLTPGSFEQALKRLKKGVRSQLGRARIVTTTRPTPFDEQLMRDVLPVPHDLSRKEREESFAMTAMRERPTGQLGREEDAVVPDWRAVALMPLSDSQIVEFARDQGVEDPQTLLEDLERRNAQEFARRPQDLIELCADWRQHKRIRTHRDQVAANVRVKLQPRDEGPEPTELSVDKAIEGASRLALATQFTRRMTIRHSAAADVVEDEAALDPAFILSDWKPDERKALLERPLFGFASYGRVRFHHRSVAEYLAAERLRALRDLGMPFRALKRLIFAQTKDKTIVRPSKRPIAGWLALTEDGIFEMLRDNEPAVLLAEGDPETLSISQRSQALHAYVERYGAGGWRGLSVPHIQIHRFASPELAKDVNQLWETGVENPEVREMLLYLVKAGPVAECADIARRAARNSEASLMERLTAIDAMLANQDPTLPEIAADVATAENPWPERVTWGIVQRLFPHNLSVKQLCQVLSRLNEGKGIVDHMRYGLPHLIKNAELDPASLEALRDGLVELVSAGLRWENEWPHITCDRTELSGALAATCAQGLERSKSNAWLHASVLALRLQSGELGNDEPHKMLHERLGHLAADDNARLFWTADSFFQSLHAIPDPWARLAEVILHDGLVEFHAERDLHWIKGALGDRTRSTETRAMLLQAAMRVFPYSEDQRAHVLALKPLVDDQPSLITAINEFLKPSKFRRQQKRWKQAAATRKKQQERRRAKAKADWIQFQREVAERPDSTFSSELSWSTAWYLWHAMSHDGNDTRVWNRGFIEEHFGKETTDRLRDAMMNVWRDERPTLPSERPEGERGTILRRWLFGLAGIYAEAEDPFWATRLSEQEAKLAARYALFDNNGLPLWLESLIDVYPEAVDATIGNELTCELQRKPSPDGNSILLQNISSAPQPVALAFLPRLREWLDREGDIFDAKSYSAGAAWRLGQVVGSMLRNGDEETHAHLVALARQRLQEDLPEELEFVWLGGLMRLSPTFGVTALESRISTVEPAARSQAITWFSVLFGDRHDAINLRSPAFTPQLLLRLLRHAFVHVRLDDDVKHEGVYSPDVRDQAEWARHQILSALLESTGEDGLAAKLEMAEDPLFGQFKDYVLAIAEERWAEEFDSLLFDERQAVALDRTGEAPPSTNEAMFAIMNDRLADLDELLLRDASPRELWAGITDEKIMRREIARELRRAANGLYTVDQEAATADEKETDIRLRSVVSGHEAVIEVKRADVRSARDLKKAISEQLVTKYMAPETTGSGCLLVTLAKNRQWKHPDTKALMGLCGLKSLLEDEANRVEQAMGGAVRLRVHLLDLRPRLGVEKNS